MGYYSTMDLKYGNKPFSEPKPPPSQGRTFHMTHPSGVEMTISEDISGHPHWYEKNGWTVEVVS